MIFCLFVLFEEVQLSCFSLVIFVETEESVEEEQREEGGRVLE